MDEKKSEKKLKEKVDQLLTTVNSEIGPVSVTIQSAKPWIGYTVGFVIGGPEGAFSSVKVESSFGRHKSAEGDDSDIFAEAMVRAISKIPAGYEALLNAIEQVRAKYGM